MSRTLKTSSFAKNQGAPIFVKNVATVQLGPEFRRGTLDNGGREAVGAVDSCVMERTHAKSIRRLKSKIAEIEPACKYCSRQARHAVKLVPYYDRTEIIHETMATLSDNSCGRVRCCRLDSCFVLLHLRSSVAVLPTLPLA